MFFDIGGWWLTCDHMFRRFGTPFAADWIAKNVNGYLYTAAIPADPSSGSRPPSTARATCRASRATRLRRPHRRATSARCCRTTARTSSTGGATACVPEIERNFAYLDGYDTDGGRWWSSPCCSRTRSTSTTGTGRSTGCSTLPSSRRRWRSTPRSRRSSGEVDPALPGPLQVGRRSQLGLHRGALEDQGAGEGRRRAARRVRGRDGRRRRSRALEGSDAGRAFLERRRRPVPPASSAASRSGRTSSSTRRGTRARRRSWRPSAATSRRTTTTRRPSTP